MPASTKSVLMLPIEALQRGSYQPRQHFDPVALSELAESIKKTGLIQPVVVRMLAPKHYEIIAGERRWRAAQQAGLQEIACLLREATDEETAAISTIENVNRVDLNPIEEAYAYRRLMDEFCYSHEEVAAAVGKSRSRITNALRLLKLEPSVQQWLADGLISEGHGKMLAALPQPKQVALARDVVTHGWSVRQLEAAVKEVHAAKPKQAAPMKDPNISRLEEALGDHVGCKVAIEHQGGQCSLTLDCHNLDVLEGVLEKMGFKASAS